MFFTDPDDAALRRMYAVPAAPTSRPFLRANFITTLDGRLTGGDGTSSSINNAADKRVFDVLRSLADVVVVGAGTVRSEGYDRLRAGDSGRAPDLVVVSDSGVMPESVLTSARDDQGVPRGRAILATHAAADGLDAAQRTVHQTADVEELICGAQSVDLAALMLALAERGARSVLCEGGPALFTSVLSAGLVDEIALTTAPRLVGTVGRAGATGVDRVLTTAPVDIGTQWQAGALIDGTLFSLWRVSRSR